MQFFHEYSNKKFKISPYNTSIEKDILLSSAMGEPTLSDVLSICHVSEKVISTLTTEEKMVMLLKLREISIGSEVNLKFKCNKCGSGNENTIVMDNIIENAKIVNNNIIDKFKIVNDDNIKDFIDIDDIDELDLLEYEDIVKEIKESVTKFNFRKTIICQKCQSENSIRINDKNFIIQNMSEDSLKSLYQTYNDMMFFGNYSKADIDSLYPFERTILISLLNKTREDQNK